jgi:hypothetical protein
MMPLYFGFYGNGYLGGIDAIAETDPYGNVDWLEPGNDFRFKVQQTRSRGKKAIINVTNVMYEYPRAVMKEDAEAALKYIWNELYGLENSVIAFAMADEPWRANENGNFGLSEAVIEANLNFGAQMIRRVTNGRVASLITASGGEYDKYRIPTEVNWLGMYRYSYNTHWSMLLVSVINLVRKKQTNQQIFAIVDAFEWPGKPIDESRIKTFNSWWKTAIGWFPSHFIGVAPFMYKTIPMGQGAESMPRVLADLAQWSVKFPRFGVAV